MVSRRRFASVFSGLTTEQRAEWDAFDAAKADETFWRLFNDYIYPAEEDAALLALLRDRLIDIGTEQYADGVMRLVGVTRRNQQLPF